MYKKAGIHKSWLLLLPVAPAFENNKKLNSQSPNIAISEKAILPGVGVTVSKNLIAQRGKAKSSIYFYLYLNDTRLSAFFI